MRKVNNWYSEHIVFEKISIETLSPRQKIKENCSIMEVRRVVFQETKQAHFKQR